jgi:uncharacterized protein YhbP (UPF0306 family)
MLDNSLKVSQNRNETEVYRNKNEALMATRGRSKKSTELTEEELKRREEALEYAREIDAKIRELSGYKLETPEDVLCMIKRAVQLAGELNSVSSDNITQSRNNYERVKGLQFQVTMARTLQESMKSSVAADLKGIQAKMAEIQGKVNKQAEENKKLKGLCDEKDARIKRLESEIEGLVAAAFENKGGVAQEVERGIHIPEVVGSSPAPAIEEEGLRLVQGVGR